MAKKLIGALLMVTLLLSSIMVFSVAADSEIRITDYKVVDVVAGNKAGPFYVFFTLSESIKPARHFQNYGRTIESGMDMDVWDFSDELVDAGRNSVFVNGASVGEIIEATGDVYTPSLHYEKDKENPNIQWFVIYVNGYGVDRTKDTITIEVKKGLISREGKAFEPFKAVWNSTTQTMDLYRENDQGLSLNEVKALGGVIPSATKDPTQSQDAKQPQTSEATATTNSDSMTATESSATATESSTTTTEWRPHLGKYDITTADTDITIDTKNSVITVARGMTVSEFLSKLQAVDGYDTNVYNGIDIVDPDTPLYTGYKYKVRVQDLLIGNFLIEVTEDTPGVDWLVVVVVAAGVLLIGAALTVWLLLCKKAKKEKFRKEE